MESVSYIHPGGASEKSSYSTGQLLYDAINYASLVDESDYLLNYTFCPRNPVFCPECRPVHGDIQGDIQRETHRHSDKMTRNS